MKKLVSLSLALALCVSMLAGCGNNDASTASNAGSAAGTETGSAADTATNAAEGDLDTSKFLKIQDDNPDTVDPQCTTEYYTVAMNIFDRLVEVKANDDGTSEIVPSLAKSWTVSDDGLTYTFTLNEGVKFTNGRPHRLRCALHHQAHADLLEGGQR